MATQLGSDDPLRIGAILEDARNRQGIDIETRAGRRPLPRRLILGAIVAEIAILLLILGLTAGDDDDGASGRRGASQERQTDKPGSDDKQGGGGKQGGAPLPKDATVKLLIRSDLQACVVDGGWPGVRPAPAPASGAEGPADT